MILIHACAFRREFQAFVGGIVREKFPGVKLQSHALAIMQEAGEAWMRFYGEASDEEQKQLAAGQRQRTLDYMREKRALVKEHCERLGLGVYLCEVPLV